MMFAISKHKEERLADTIRVYAVSRAHLHIDNKQKDTLENYAHELATLAETFMTDATTTSASIATAAHPAAQSTSSRETAI